MRIFESRFHVFAQGIFYISAGLYHFMKPAYYLKLIPSFLPNPWLANSLVGFTLMLLGVGLLLLKTRKIASYGITLLLVLFSPVHINMIVLGGCLDGGPCMPQWMAFIRLALIQPALIVWSWLSRQEKYAPEVIDAYENRLN